MRGDPPRCRICGAPRSEAEIRLSGMCSVCYRANADLRRASGVLDEIDKIQQRRRQPAEPRPMPILEIVGIVIVLAALIGAAVLA